MPSLSASPQARTGDPCSSRAPTPSTSRCTGDWWPRWSASARPVRPANATGSPRSARRRHPWLWSSASARPFAEDTSSHPRYCAGLPVSHCVLSRASGKVAISLGTAADGTITDESVTAVAEGALLGAYSYRRYRNATLHGYLPPVRSVVVLVADPIQRSAKQAVARAKIVCDAVCTVRDLVNTPPSDLHPREFADIATARSESGRPCDRGARRESPEEGRLRRHHRRRAGLGESAATGADGLPAPEGDEDHRPRRQGHHLRLRRSVAQAGGADGVDEVRHGRRGSGPDGDGGDRAS